jgi:elongation factor Ts
MVTPQMIKELRERTGVGMSDCKNALVEANGDMDMAIDLLRKKGLAKAAKRAGNETSEGKIKIVADGGATYVAVVTCETDFVSRNDTFDAMVSHFIDIRKAESSDEAALAKAEELKASEYTLRVGENIVIRTLTKIEGEVIASYVHSNFKNAALVIAKAGTDADKLKQVAMHVVASSPQVVSPTDISDEIVAIQLEIMKQDPKNAGKPEEILAKIIDGKMTKFREENALLTQPFVVNPDIKVGDFIGKDAVVSFIRYSI